MPTSTAAISLAAALLAALAYGPSAFADPEISSVDGGWRGGDVGMTCLHRGRRYDAEIHNGVGKLSIDGVAVNPERIVYSPDGFAMTVSTWSETSNYEAMMGGGRASPCLRVRRSAATILDEPGFEFADAEERCCEWR